jgi:diacylglycerol kinase family enzyme
MSGAAVCVIYNPAAGKGRGAQRLNKLRRVLGARAAFWPTEQAGHADELARRAAVEGFPIVAAAGGDGTAHEVANGILRAQRPDVTFAVIPVGSANDYAYSLGLDAEWWLRPDDHVAPRPVDVGLVYSGQRSRYFINGLGLGFNGAVTLESRKIKRLQGLTLYGLALLRALCFHFAHPQMRIRLDGAEDRSGPTLAFSLAIGRREGNFVVAPDAVLDDGLFDYIYAGPLTRLDLLRFVPGLAVGHLPEGHPKVGLGRCRGAQVISDSPLTVHIDGEFFCRPEDDCRELTVEILPRRLRVFRRLDRADTTVGSS